eukprot:9425006-Lingulodinium_polyedra.AAC.1
MLRVLCPPSCSLENRPTQAIASTVDRDIALAHVELCRAVTLPTPVVQQRRPRRAHSCQLRSTRSAKTVRRGPISPAPNAAAARRTHFKNVV